MIPDHRTFCSKSCIMKYRNRIAIQNGTHNMLSKNGWSKFMSKRNSDDAKKGIHPFQHLSKEVRESNGKLISEARIREAKEGNHPWQSIKSRINNEYSRSLTIIKQKNLKHLFLYISNCEFDGMFKIGWTTDVEWRFWDSRTHELSNVVKLKEGDAEFIVKLEHDIKLKFMNHDYFNKTKSAEIFDNEIKDKVIEYINSI